MRYLIWALLAYICYRIVVKLVSGRHRQAEQPVDAGKGIPAHQDPVCGVFVSEEDAVIGRLEDKRYFFCSKECLEKFQEKIENKKG